MMSIFPISSQMKETRIKLSITNIELAFESRFSFGWRVFKAAKAESQRSIEWVQIVIVPFGFQILHPLEISKVPIYTVKYTESKNMCKNWVSKYKIWKYISRIEARGVMSGNYPGLNWVHFFALMLSVPSVKINFHILNYDT